MPAPKRRICPAGASSCRSRPFRPPRSPGRHCPGSPPAFQGYPPQSGLPCRAAGGAGRRPVMIIGCAYVRDDRHEGTRGRRWSMHSRVIAAAQIPNAISFAGFCRPTHGSSALSAGYGGSSTAPSCSGAASRDRRAPSLRRLERPSSERIGSRTTSIPRASPTRCPPSNGRETGTALGMTRAARSKLTLKAPILESVKGVEACISTFSLNAFWRTP